MNCSFASGLPKRRVWYERACPWTLCAVLAGTEGRGMLRLVMILDGSGLWYGE